MKFGEELVFLRYKIVLFLESVRELLERYIRVKFGSGYLYVSSGRFCYIGMNY